MRNILRSLARFTVQQSKLLSAVAMAAVIGGASTAAVLAAIPDASGVIHSCYRNGALQKSFRVIDSPSQSCNGNETALDWDQRRSPLLANLAGGSFQESVWTYFDLRNLNFTNADLSQSNMKGSDFRGANVSGVNFSATDLRKTNLSGLNLSGLYMYGTNLSNATLAGSNLAGANLSYATLDGVNMGGFNLTGTLLAGIRADGGNFSNIILSTNEDLKGAQLTSSSFNGVNFTGADFTDANLRDSSFTGASFTGAIWIRTNCADGTFSDDNGGTCIGHM
jgi:uncharacterized protein YjbI with pentapeptide repeats